MTGQEAREILGAYYPLSPPRPARQPRVELPCVPAKLNRPVHEEYICGACGASLLPAYLPTRCGVCGTPNVSVWAFRDLELDRAWREIREIAKAFKGEIIFKTNGKIGSRWEDI